MTALPDIPALDAQSPLDLILKAIADINVTTRREGLSEQASMLERGFRLTALGAEEEVKALRARIAELEAYLGRAIMAMETTGMHFGCGAEPMLCGLCKMKAVLDARSGDGGAR